MIKNLPAVPFMMLVAQFAIANGLKFFTIKDQNNAIELYNQTAKILN